MVGMEYVMVGAGVAMLVVAAYMNRKSASAPPSSWREKRDEDPPSSRRRERLTSRPSVPASRGEAPTEPEAHLAPADIDQLPLVAHDQDEDGADLTRITVSTAHPPDDDTADSEKPSVLPIIFDEEAAVDIPTAAQAYILVSAVGQTDIGRRRKNNEDSYLLLDDPPIFIVADGMGGYAGGEVASKMAVDEIRNYFLEGPGEKPSGYPSLPRRAALLVEAVQRANRKILRRASRRRELEGMGTTLVCAHFSPSKQRLYVGHVGDSRCYRVRHGEMKQVTTDHTIGVEGGVKGPFGATLTRALGVENELTVDLILGEPRPGDVYIICSDGLNKMVSDRQILTIVRDHPHPDDAVDALIKAAIDGGGKDNVTVVVVLVEAASDQ
ncbi:MAG: protein phosphatase 2C domain-containing protein [Myxococcota bacterium]